MFRMFEIWLDKFLSENFSIDSFVLAISIFNSYYCNRRIKYNNKEITKEEFFIPIAIVALVFIWVARFFPKSKPYICLFLLIATVVNFIFYKLKGKNKAKEDDLS